MQCQVEGLEVLQGVRSPELSDAKVGLHRHELRLEDEDLLQEQSKPCDDRDRLQQKAESVAKDFHVQRGSGRDLPELDSTLTLVVTDAQLEH